MVKNCDLGHSFSPYGPPSRQITYIYFLRSTLIVVSAVYLYQLNFHFVELLVVEREFATDADEQFGDS